MIFVYLKGLGLGASLIIAIGAQNAFVLSQAIRGKFNRIILLICSFTDALLISIGVLGIGTLFASHPGLTTGASIGGGIFLLWYGLKSFLSALKPGKMEEDHNGPRDLKAAVLFTLAVSLLNPHAILDTVFLLGGISSQFEGKGKYIFGAGAVTASFLWFFTLSFFGKLLSPFFKNPRVWKILDVIIGVIMWYIAYTLIRSVL